MGLKDRLERKLTAKYADRDWNAELSAAMDDGDQLLGFATGRAAAVERKSTGYTASSRLNSMVVTGLKNQLSQANHIGGDKGSIAANLPLQGAINSGTLAISAFGLSVWHFDLAGAAPSCTLRIPREDLTSITRMPARGHSGYDLARVLFRDGSFFDFLILDHESSAQFWTAAALVRPSA